LTFRVIEHTADLGLEAEGATQGEALAEAALGLTSVLTGKPHPHALARPDRELRFTVEAPDRAALAVAFLSEILWAFESQDPLWLGGGVDVGPGDGDGTVRATASGNGCVHDANRHGRGVEVKAITYHGLEFGPVERRPGWRLRVILDI